MLGNGHPETTTVDCKYIPCDKDENGQRTKERSGRHLDTAFLKQMQKAFQQRTVVRYNFASEDDEFHE